MSAARPEAASAGLADAEQAAAALAEGALVAFPTETVWGLAAPARDAAAVAALLAWKGRAPGHPLPVLVPGLRAIGELAPELSPEAQRLAAALWPGPLTLVVRAGGPLAPGVAGADGTLGLRCSPHPAAMALVRAALAAGLGLLTATSLNRSGRPPARTRAEAAALCSGAGAPRLFDAGPDAGGAAPSTVVDCTDGARVLREGAVPAARILALVGAEPDPAPVEGAR